MANQYFAKQELPIGEFKITDEGVRHHMFHVMRLRKGDQVELVFNEQQVARCEVLSPEEAILALVEVLSRNTELPIEVTIAVGFPKADKLDFITEKATELGAAAVWAAPFDWSVVKWNKEKLLKRQERLAKIAQGAAEQSKRLCIPKVLLFEHQTELIGKFSEFAKVLIAYEESAKQGESSKLTQSLQSCKAGDKVLILFGPEGGISPKEISSFLEAGAEVMGLGPRILRAETAPLYALAAISAKLEL